MKVENIDFKINKYWTVNVDGDTIKVENKPHTLELTVNNKLQDIYIGSIACPPIRLTGKLSNGKDIKVSVGGNFKIHCCIFVEHELVLEDKI